jgi:hypothetical protein
LLFIYLELLKVDAHNLQAATRSCFYAGFAAQRNFAEVNTVSFGFYLFSNCELLLWKLGHVSFLSAGKDLYLCNTSFISDLSESQVNLICF